MRKRKKDAGGHNQIIISLTSALQAIQDGVERAILALDWIPMKPDTLDYVALHPNAVEPTKGDEQAACYDLACPKGTQIDVVAGQEEPIKVPLGLAISIPPGYHAKVYPRSSMPLRYKATLANCTAIIDSGYLNEWILLVLPCNWGPGDCVLFKDACFEGAKLAQFEIVPNGLDVGFRRVKDFEGIYNRGGGFGSTGK